MSEVAYSKPFIIAVVATLTRITDTVTITYCLQANGPAPGATLVQQAYDPGNACQLWVYGSDQRIYLASTLDSTPLCIDTEGGAIANSPALVLSPVKANKTQQWYLYNRGNPSSYIGLVHSPRIVMGAWNDTARRIGPGRFVGVSEATNGFIDQIWAVWSPSSLPWQEPVPVQGATRTEGREAEAARAAAEAAAAAAREALAAAEAARKSAENAEARSAKEAADARTAAEAAKAEVQAARDAQVLAAQEAKDARTIVEAVKIEVQAARDAQARAAQQAADAMTMVEAVKAEVQAARTAGVTGGAEAQTVERAVRDAMAAAEAAKGFAAEAKAATIAGSDAGCSGRIWIWIAIGLVSLVALLMRHP